MHKADKDRKEEVEDLLPKCEADPPPGEDGLGCRAGLRRPSKDHLEGLQRSGSKDRPFRSKESPDPQKEGSEEGLTSTEAVKEKVSKRNMTRDAEKAPAYNVHDFYHKTGIFSLLAKNALFENFTLGVIVVNAIWISIDTDYNGADTLLDAKMLFVIADSLFFSYFSIELFVRFMAFAKKSSCCCDAWFVFDSTLVGLYAFDPFMISIMAAQSGGKGLDLPTAILRLFRLARLSRLVRMLRSLPELMIMIKGMVTATASVSYTLGLLILITYVFAIALCQLSDGAEFREELFSSVPLGMYNLIIYGTFLDDLSYFCDAIKAESTPCLILVTLFVVLASMTVMNMLIGVLCEVISQVAEKEREDMDVDKVHNTFHDIVTQLDQNGNNMISWKEFGQMVENPKALSALASVNVDAEGMIDFAEDFFWEDEKELELTFEEFMEMLLALRGGQEATLEDVMRLGKRMNKKFSGLKQQSRDIDNKVRTLIRLAGSGRKNANDSALANENR